MEGGIGHEGIMNRSKEVGSIFRREMRYGYYYSGRLYNKAITLNQIKYLIKSQDLFGDMIKMCNTPFNIRW